MKIIANLLVTKNIYKEEEMNEYVKHIRGYIMSVDALYIYNTSGADLSKFYEKLNRHDNIKFTECSDLGEVLNYERILNYSLELGADYSVILEPGYYYEEDSFQTIKKYIVEKDPKDIAIITPLPLYGCELHERKGEAVRYVMGGCKMVGTLVNLHIYKELKGLKKEYYKSMFDYEYCIRARLKGYKILLFNNEVLRNINYRVVEKRYLFIKLSTYDKDPIDIYYEHRNRLYLWEEYAKVDPSFVKLDKKLAKEERHIMRWRDPAYRDKLAMFEKAESDFKHGIMGKIKFSNKELRS